MLLTALLVAALAVQLLTVDAIELPPAGPVGGRRTVAAVPAVSGATGTSIILARSMFAPVAVSAGAGASPLAGIAIIGSVGIGRDVFAVVQRPDNRTARVRIGGQIGEWRLKAIRDNQALLTRQEEQISVPFGARAPLPATAAATGNP